MKFCYPNSIWDLTQFWRKGIERNHSGLLQHQFVFDSLNSKISRRNPWKLNTGYLRRIIQHIDLHTRGHLIGTNVSKSLGRTRQCHLQCDTGPQCICRWRIIRWFRLHCNWVWSRNSWQIPNRFRVTLLQWLSDFFWYLEMTNLIFDSEIHLGILESYMFINISQKI